MPDGTKGLYMQNKILATVGGFPITDKDVDDFLLSLGQRAQSYNTPEGRKAVLNQLVSNKLLLLDAKRNLLERDAEFRDKLNALKDQLLVSYAGEKAISGAKVTDAEAKSYYEENKAQFMTEESVGASHILVKTEELAKEIYENIISGKTTFEDAAREFSTCPSKENGGSLGEFGRGQMVPEFDTAVFSMSVGEISKEPVKTQFGYHLIRLDSKNEAKEIPYAEISENIKSMLLSEKQRKSYESKINQLKILYPVDMML
jgi:peptidyl-prolyl cis-trans isomerase C